MKRTIVMSTLVLTLSMSSVFAAENNYATTLTVKNMTDQSLVIQSEESPAFIPMHHLKINGTTDTPSETIPANGTGTFVVSDEGYNGAMSGNIFLFVNGEDPMQTAHATFPVWVGGDGAESTVIISGPVSSASNQQFTVGAFELDATDGVVNIYPAVSHK